MGKFADNKGTCVPFAVRNFSELDDAVGLTPREAAQMLRIGLSTFWSWCKAGRIDVRRIGRTTRVSAGELRRIMAEA